MDNRSNIESGQAWYFFAPSSKERQRRRRPAVFRLLASVLTLAFFVAAFVYPPAENPNSDRRKSPYCEVYPITTEKELTGVVNFFEASKIVSAKYAVWEKTQQRMIFEEEIPGERIASGSFTVPALSVWDDYVEHFTEYTGFETKGDYKQELRVTVRYMGSDGELKARTFAADPVETNLCWMQKASKKHGALHVKEGYVTEILHRAPLRNYVRDCYIEQPGRVNKTDIISVRVKIDGKDTLRKPESERVGNGLIVVRIPIPEGQEQDGSHTLEIYVTQYIGEFKKALEFLTVDTY